MPRPLAFISSTYLDLKFERRFVRDLLQRQGFDVVMMEESCRPEHNWERWSENRAGQCDVFVQLLADRIGTLATKFFLHESITRREYSRAQLIAAKAVRYQLHRPFPDEKRLYSDSEEQEYKQSLEERDNLGDVEARLLEKWTRIADHPIKSVEELENQVLRDVRLSRWEMVRHRWRNWSRAYWNTTRAAALRAFADETYVASSNRVALWRHLRTPMLIASIPAILVMAWSLPLLWTIAALAIVALVCSAAILAWAPSFCWVGTKTIMARDIFGLRTVQQSRLDPFRVAACWKFRARGLGIGSLTVHFADGRRVFVPLIYNPDEIASKATILKPVQPEPPSVEQPTEYPDFDVALQEFVEMLQCEGMRSHGDEMVE